MSLKDQQIEELKQELALTREDFSTKLQNLEQKLSILTENKRHQIPPQPTKAQSEQNSILPGLQSQTDDNSKDLDVKPQHKQRLDSASPPSGYKSFIKESCGYLLSILAPATKLVSPLLNLYRHYQGKGQGPIFVFMLIGIVLLVGGFGYLAQLLVGELGAGSKTLLLFVVAVGITIGGARLAKRSKYLEVSSAIVSLGLLLNFVTVYMAGSFYQLLPDWAVLLSYFAIACTGFVLANQYDAKIVSALALIGGGAIPLVSQLDQLGTSYYLIGLGFILLTSLYQAAVKNWQWLGYISVFITYSCIEFLLLTNITTLSGLFSQGFYCIFLFYICHLLKGNSQYSKELIVLVVITVFANIGALYQNEFANVWALPVIAAFNSSVSLFLFIQARKQQSYSVSLHAIIASTWLLVAMISSFTPDYWGFAIGLEGLFILYFALKENYFSVRIEGYALLAFAILHALLAVLPYFPDPALLSLKGNLVVVSIGVLIFCSRKLFSQFPSDINWETRLSQALRPAESIWLTVYVLSLLWTQLGVWSAITILPLQVILLIKAYRGACHITEMMAYLAGLVILAICIFGINEVQSLSFRELPNYAKIAILLVFTECWLFAEFYRRAGSQGQLANLAEILRLGFYLLIPLTFLPSVFRHYIEFSALALWGSAGIAYLIGRRIKHPLIRTESLVLFLIGSLYNLGYCFYFYEGDLLFILASSLIGLCLFAYFLHQTYHRNSALLDKKVATLGWYFLAGCIAIYVEKWSNIYLAGAFTSAYFFTLTLCTTHHPILIRNRGSLGYISFFSLVGSWLGISLAGGHHIISASLWGILSLVISLTFLIKANILNGLNLKLFSDSKTGYTTQHILLALTGVCLLSGWELTLLVSPWLILQGSYLFFTHKHSKFVAKLALCFMTVGLLKLGLVDAANALLWQKVALMIGIGLFMLAAAFIYQKRLSQPTG